MSKELVNKSTAFGGNNALRKLCFGIDLGTTNSAISVVGHTNSTIPEIIPMPNGKRTLPSCVMLKGGEFIVGEKAYKQRYKKSCIYSVKKLMGSDSIVRLVDEDTSELKTFTPQEISAEILKELKRVAEIKFGKVENVVITVPAYFNVNQKRATEEAGRLAGLNVLKLISEPASASMAYSLQIEEPHFNKTFLTYDLGGGTFDATITNLVIEKANAEKNEDTEDLLAGYGLDAETTEQEASSEDINITSILNIAGDNALGGDDLDKDMFKLLCNDYPELKKLNKEDKEKIILDLEMFKKNAEHSLGMEIKLKGKSYHFGKEHFVTASEKIFKRTMAHVRKITDFVDLEGTILVGGSTKNPIIRNRLAGEFPTIPQFSGINPDEIVAIGAAVEAQRAMGGNTVTLFDILSMPIGIEDDKGRMLKMLNKNNQLPCEVTRTFTTVSENQEVIEIEIYQGEDRFASKCFNLGKLVIDGFTPEADKPIDVTLSVNYSGILTVKVRVDGKLYEKELASVFMAEEQAKEALASNNENTTRESKAVLRWRSIASDSPEVLALIDRYEDGETELKADITKAVRRISEEERLRTLDSAAKEFMTASGEEGEE